MAKHYIYKNTKTGRIIFETVQPNHVSSTAVDKMVLNDTGQDPRLNPALINLSISVVPDGTTLSKKNVKKRLTKGKK